MGELSRLWYVGVIVVFFGSFGGALGDTMVRRSYVDAGAVVNARKMLENPVFVIGMCLTIILDPLLTFIGLLFAPSSIVTPFAGVHIFWAVLIAHFWLKEPMGLWQALGAVGVVVGVILIVCFSSKQADIENLSSFDSYARTPEAIAYISVSAVLLVLILLAAFSLYPCNLGDWEYSVRRLGTALASGLLGGNTNVAAKFFSIIAVELFGGRTSVFSNWRTYLVIVCTVILVLSQLIFLNLALKRYEAVYVVPTVNSCLVASGTIGSILVLHEIPGNWPAFCVGLLCCLIGIIVLTVVQRVEVQMPVVTDKEGDLEQERVTGEDDLREYDNIAESSLRRHSSTLTRSLSVSAAAVADMAVILNSQAVYSMYTMQEKQRRASSISNSAGLRMSDLPSPISLSSRGQRCRSSREFPQQQHQCAEQRASWADTLSQWLSRPGSRSKAGTAPTTSAEGEGAGRSTVSEPPLAIGRAAANPQLFDQAAVVAAVAHRRFSEAGAAAETSLERLHEDEGEEKGKLKKQSQPLHPDMGIGDENTRRVEGGALEDTQEPLQEQPKWRKQQLQQQQRNDAAEIPIVVSNQGRETTFSEQTPKNTISQSFFSVRLSPLLVQVPAPPSFAVCSPPPASNTSPTALSDTNAAAPAYDTVSAAAVSASDTSPAAAVSALDTSPAPADSASDTSLAAAAFVNKSFPATEESLVTAENSPRRLQQQQACVQKAFDHSIRTDSP